MSFFRDRGGHRIAYAEQGQGPLLVLPAWWVSHLERDADNPAYRRFFDGLATHFRVVRYDRLGVGLSDRVPRPFTLDTELEHLKALADHLAADRVHLFGLSCGGPTAVAFAARHPARVAKMVLYGSYLEGRKLSPDKVKQALVALVRAHWGLGSRALADIFYPGADTAVQRAFKNLQREASDAETAARLLQLTYALDASPFVQDVVASVLVLHRQDDRAIAYALGRELAARLSGARFVTLAGSIHLPWEGDAQPIVDAIVAFAGEGGRSKPRQSRAEAMLWRDGEVWALRFGTSVTVSGPCATGDAGPPYYLTGGYGRAPGNGPLDVASSVYVTSPSPGICHVELTFATGFTFTTDVTFGPQMATGCGDTVRWVGPSPVVFYVNNPVTTCLDAGPDAPAYEGTVDGGNAGVDGGGAEDAHGEVSSNGQDAEAGAQAVDASSDAACPLVPIHCAQGHCIDSPPAQCVSGTWLCPQGPPSCYAEGESD